MNEDEYCVVYLDGGWFVIPVSGARYQQPCDSPIPPLVTLPINLLPSIPLPTYVSVDAFHQTYAVTSRFSQTPIFLQVTESCPVYPLSNADGYNQYAQAIYSNIWDMNQHNGDSCQLNSLNLSSIMVIILVNIESPQCNQEDMNWGDDRGENKTFEENWNGEPQALSQPAVELVEPKGDNEGETQSGTYFCQECRKKFGRDADLKRHEKTAKPHRLLKEFRCSCSISFSRIDALKVVIISVIVCILISRDINGDVVEILKSGIYKRK